MHRRWTRGYCLCSIRRIKVKKICFSVSFEQTKTFFLFSRSLISDTNFHALLNKIQFEQIPYFLQYSRKTILGTFKPRHAIDNNHDPHGQHYRFEDKRKRNLQMLSEKHGASVNKSEKNLEKSPYIDENPIDTNDRKIEDIDVFDTKQKIKMWVFTVYQSDYHYECLTGLFCFSNNVF